MRIPEAIYHTVQFSFRPATVQDWFIETGTKDIIVWLARRGEVRLEYNPLLEIQLTQVFSI